MTDKLRRLKQNVWQKVGRFLVVFRLLKYLRPHRSKIALLIAMNAVSALLAMVLPLLTKILIDQAYANKDWDIFFKVIVINGALLIGTMLVGLVLSYFSTLIREKTAFKMQVDMQKMCSKATYRFFEGRAPGEHIFRFTTDIGNVIAVLTDLIPRVVMIVSQLLFFIVIALKLSPRLTLMFLAFLPFLLVIALVKNAKLRPLQKEMQERSSDVNDFHAQYRTGILTTKIFAKEKFEERRLVRVLAKRVRLAFRMWRLDTLYESINMLFGGGWNAAVIFYGWALVIRGEMTLGTLVALRMYLSNLSRPLQMGAAMIGTLMRGSVSAERILETFHAERETAHEGEGEPLPSLVGQVSFSDVCFGYQPDHPVLRHVSFEVEPGSIVGITGPSGVGKTTLINLIARLYEVDSGTICIDGSDLSRMSIPSLRRQLSVLSQEPFLFAGTIRENILYGRRTATEAEMQEAAVAAQAHDFVMDLENGYDTVLGKDGISLSAGQKQRIALARALVRNTPILILDEFTASLDAESEVGICRSIQEHFSDKTIFTVSHKVSHLMEADLVLVLYKGTITEQGSPQELLNHDGLFRKLYRLQYRFSLIQAEQEYNEMEKELVEPAAAAG